MGKARERSIRGGASNAGGCRGNTAKDARGDGGGGGGSCVRRTLSNNGKAEKGEGEKGFREHY